MQKPRVRLLLIHVLPFLHLCACFTIALARFQSGWKYLAVADVPMTVLIVALIYNYDHPLLLFGVLGTLWWYLLSRSADMLVRRLRAGV